MHKRIDNLGDGPGTHHWGGAQPASGIPGQKPVLLIVHQHASSPGNVGNWFRANGFPLDIRRPRFGDPFPETLENHTGAVIFGGPQSANDTDDYIRRETEWISVALKEDKPFLGICLGAQMLANHLGGSVKAHPEGCVEHGYYPIMPTSKGAEMMDWPAHVYQWHREGFSAPKSSTLLAEGKFFPEQAFKYGSGFGLQFHPEITHLVMNRWVTRSGYRLIMPGARPGAKHKSEHMLYGPGQLAWLGQFLESWVVAGANNVAAPALAGTAAIPR